MKDYPFYDLINGKSIPRMARQILADFRILESRLCDRMGHGGFCKDGELIQSFNDGWGWYKINDGNSKQEALAMHHCGNQGGKRGDVLYSLREPFVQGSSTRLKPHLTFIVNNGLVGEAKGFANQKPDSCFAKYIEAFLKIEDIRGVEKITFNFLIFLNRKEKPDFRFFDPLGEGGNSILKVSDTQTWRHFFDFVTVAEFGQMACFAG